MLSLGVGDEILKFKYEKTANEMYEFYIGDIFLGHVSNTPSGWCAVSKNTNRMGTVCGFKNRDRAAEYLLKLDKYME